MLSRAVRKYIASWQIIEELMESFLNMARKVKERVLGF